MAPMGLQKIDGYVPVQTAARFSRKASMPSTASLVIMFRVMIAAVRLYAAARSRSTCW